MKTKKKEYVKVPDDFFVTAERLKKELRETFKKYRTASDFFKGITIKQRELEKKKRATN